jgi:hypothetical protein
VIRCAKAMFWLYGNVFRSLESVDAGAPAGEPARRRA